MDRAKFIKLLSLALDPRGSDKEADLAAAKAMKMARDAKLSPEDIGFILAPAPEPEPLHIQPPPSQSFVGVVNEMTRGVDAMQGLFSRFQPKRRRA